MVGLSTHARGTRGDHWRSSEMENGSLWGFSKYVLNDDFPKVKLLVQWSQGKFSRGRVTIARQTKPTEMDCGASNITNIIFVFFRQYLSLTSVAAQLKWILRQLQPGGGKGLCSCPGYIDPISRHKSHPCSWCWGQVRSTWKDGQESLGVWMFRCFCWC